MKSWFNKLNRLVKLILLIIPIVGWIIELCIRWPEFISKKSLGALLLAIIATVHVLNFLDAIWCLLTDHMLFVK